MIMDFFFFFAFVTYFIEMVAHLERPAYRNVEFSISALKNMSIFVFLLLLLFHNICNKYLFFIFIYNMPSIWFLYQQKKFFVYFWKEKKPRIKCDLYPVAFAQQCRATQQFYRQTIIHIDTNCWNVYTKPFDSNTHKFFLRHTKHLLIQKKKQERKEKQNKLTCFHLTFMIIFIALHFLLLYFFFYLPFLYVISPNISC